MNQGKEASPNANTTPIKSFNSFILKKGQESTAPDSTGKRKSESRIVNEGFVTPLKLQLSGLKGEFKFNSPQASISVGTPFSPHKTARFRELSPEVDQCKKKLNLDEVESNSKQINQKSTEQKEQQKADLLSLGGDQSIVSIDQRVFFALGKDLKGPEIEENNSPKEVKEEQGTEKESEKQKEKEQQKVGQKQEQSVMKESDLQGEEEKNQKDEKKEKQKRSKSCEKQKSVKGLAIRELKQPEKNAKDFVKEVNQSEMIKNVKKKSQNQVKEEGKKKYQKFMERSLLPSLKLDLIRENQESMLHVFNSATERICSLCKKGGKKAELLGAGVVDMIGRRKDLRN